LLAHTIYQTILFDESVKTGGFELGETSLAGNGPLEWEGLSGVILKQEGWFGQWVDGERKCLSLLLSSFFPLSLLLSFLLSFNILIIVLPLLWIDEIVR
jgi:hypothetical protein